ncbi:MAG: M13-type metalloendopeptidase [Eggerthellaceae bacterium]|jgi:putative endopeptidase
MRQDKRHRPLNGTKWVNADIVGHFDSQAVYREQDDFHTAVNANWLSSAKIQPGNSSESSFWERMREVEGQVKSLLSDPDLVSSTNAPTEARIVQRLYRSLLDMDARDALGFDPVMPYVERINAVGSLEDLTALLSDNAYLFTTVFCSTETFADKKDSLNNVVYLDRSSLSLVDADEYRHITDQGKRMKAANDSFFAWLLERAGFSPSSANQMVADMFELETAVASHCLGAADQARDDFEEITYNVRTLAQLTEAAGAYPIAGILQAQGLAASRRFILGEPEWLEAIANLYQPTRLEQFKAWMTIRTLLSFSGFLDRETYDRTEQWSNERIGSVGSMPLERKAYDTVNALLGMAVGRVYVDRFLAPETKADVEHLIDQVVDTYRDRLSHAKWLSQQTREKAVEKLDALTVRVGYPTSWPDYGVLDIDDGTSLVDQYLAIEDFEYRRAAAKVNQPVDREEWLMSPHAVNAYYLPTDNSINILAGILGGVFYNPQASVEDNMGGIGMVIGHEITHAFDKNGSLYDRDGNLGNSWWTDEDRAAFKERTDRVADYWNNIEVLPGLNVDGDLCVGEIVADLGGMACMTQIAHSIPGFDFARMYRAYARDWRMIESQQMAEYLLINDVHAPAHLRTNGTVQQLDEFYSAFDVQPQDGMYLAPEARLSVW